MATKVEFYEGISTPKYYIVAVKGMMEDEIDIKGKDGEKITLKLPTSRNDNTMALTEEGIVKSVPRGGNKELLEKKVRFWFANTDFTIRSGIEIPRHVLVPDYDIVQVEDKMYGEYLFCTPIYKTYGLLYLPTIQEISYDSLQAPKQEWSDCYLDKGVIARENNSFPVGTNVFWGNPDAARQNWDGGFLIKAKYIQATGDGVPDTHYVKRKKK